MSERIRHRYEKTSPGTSVLRAAGHFDTTETIGIIAITCFLVTRPYA